MNKFNIGFTTLNGLEFVTFIIIPSGIIIFILLYIYFNYGAIKGTLNYDFDDDFDFDDHINPREKLDL